MEKELKKRKRKNISLRKKSVTVVLIASIVLSLIAVIISGGFYAYSTFNHYKELAEQLADTAASQLSAKDIVRYYDEVKLIGDYDDDKYWSDDAYRADYDKKANALKDEKFKQMLNTLFVLSTSMFRCLKKIKLHTYLTQTTRKISTNSELYALFQQKQWG